MASIKSLSAYSRRASLTSYVVGFFRKGASCSKRLEWSLLLLTQATILHDHHPANEPSFKVYNQPAFLIHLIHRISHGLVALPIEFMFFKIPFLFGLQPFQPEILPKGRLRSASQNPDLECYGAF